MRWLFCWIWIWSELILNRVTYICRLVTEKISYQQSHHPPVKFGERVKLRYLVWLGKNTTVTHVCHTEAFNTDTNTLEHTHTHSHLHTHMHTRTHRLAILFKRGRAPFFSLLSPCLRQKVAMETGLDWKQQERKKEIRCSAHLSTTPPLCPSLKIPLSNTRCISN